jgi:hypothetical protein
LGTEVEQRLVVCRHVTRGQESLRELAGLAPGEGPVGDGAREHATHVGVKNRHALAKRKRRHGVGRVLTHAGQAAKLEDVAGNVTEVLVADQARRAVEGLGSAMVAESFPKAKGARQRRVGAGTRVGENIKKTSPGF